MSQPLRFIPFRQSDLIEMCLHKTSLNQEERQAFRRVAQQIQHYFHLDFYSTAQQLNDCFNDINPDRDTRVVDLPATMHKEHTPFAEQLAYILEKANFDQQNEATLEQALRENSLFKVQLAVDFADFSEVLLYTRGESEKEETVTTGFGLRKQTLRFTNYDRVVLYLRVSEQISPERQAQFGLQPGGVILKLFKNVPKADLEMLFPNTEIRMRLIDKLLIGIPAAVSGGVVITTKMGGTLVLLASLFGFWLGLSTQPVQLDQAALLGLLAGFGALGSYLWKQFSNFKNRKLMFVQRLTRNLYFKNLDNNAGVFHRLIHDAEEEECKEALLAYYFLLTSPTPLPQPALDQKIEAWLREQWDCTLDFEIYDALAKLKQLGMISMNNQGEWAAVPLAEARKQLNLRWISQS